MTQKIISPFLHSLVLPNLLSLWGLRSDKTKANGEVNFLLLLRDFDKFVFGIRYRKVLWVVLLLTGLSSLSAQDRSYSMIYLKDGSIYKGQVEAEDENALYVLLSTGNAIRLPKVIIKKVLKGEEYLFYKNGRFHDTKGFFWAVGMGFNPISREEDGDTPSEHFEVLLGWRFNKQVSLAAGFGTELNSTQVGGFPVETLFSSFFIYGRYYLADWRRRPFLYSRAGYASGPDADFDSGRHSGGLQMQAGIGLHFASKKRSKFVLSLGYHLQKTDGTQFYLDPFGNEIKLDYNLLIHQPVLKFTAEFR